MRSGQYPSSALPIVSRLYDILEILEDMGILRYQDLRAWYEEMDFFDVPE